MRSLPVLAIIVSACATQPAPAPAPSIPAFSTAEQLVTAMHDRYAGTWYSTLTFVQKNTRYLADGRTDTSTWSEALSLPGKLRIDVEPRANGNGNIYRNDTVYVFNSGRLVRRARAPQRAAAPWLRRILRAGRARDRHPSRDGIRPVANAPVDVAGTARVRGRRVAGRHAHAAVWIDRDRLVFVRLIEPSRRDTAKTSEIRFNRYYEVGGAWLSPEVEFLIDGARDFLEEYTEVRTGVSLDEAVFDPAKWR